MRPLCAFAVILFPLLSVADYGKILNQLSSPTPTSFMVVGDSISNGWEGDYTWRYRLWEWMVDEHLDVDFVGPYSGTAPPDDSKEATCPGIITEPAPSVLSVPRTSGGYAKDIQEEWPSDHFSVWGSQVMQDKDLIRAVVEEYSPDYLLVQLGFNDIGWFVSDAEGTLAGMKELIANARSAKPDLKFAIANIPFRTSLGVKSDLPNNTDLYNHNLAQAIPEWSTAESPIRLVQLREEYDCELNWCPASYDGLHPNSLGEYQIASAFSRTLHADFDLDNASLQVPSSDIPKRPTPVPRNFNVDIASRGLKITWDPVYGAFSYDVRHRLIGTSDTSADWIESSTGSSNSFDLALEVDGQEYEYQVRTNNGIVPGYKRVSAWSDVESGVAHPLKVPAPEDIVTYATSNGVLVKWGSPREYCDVDRYEVFTFDADTHGAYVTSVGVAGHEVLIKDLIPGHHYIVKVATWIKGCIGGLPEGGHTVIIGAGRPPTPTNVQVETIDNTTVHISWTGSSSAAGYNIWKRNLNDRVGHIDGSTSDDFWGISPLVSGAWNYKFCVTAWNGNDESSLSSCIVGKEL